MNLRVFGCIVLLAYFGLLLTGSHTSTATSTTTITLRQPFPSTELRTSGGAQGKVYPEPGRRAQGTAYYVRPDGGSPEQCTGLVDAPYPGSGTSQPCTWDHPFRAFPPGGPPRIAGGDTLVIGSGSYMMGLGAPGADNPDVCDPDYPWDCHMSPTPAGPDAAHPTRILGAGWDTGSPSPPELWGTQRAYMILNLTAASNVEIAWLEITDHSGCVEDHTGGLACERDTYPYGDWAVVGLYAEDSANVHLKDLNIHGLASTGIHAARLTDWMVEDVRIAGNGWAGWDGDIDGNDSNSGTLTFRRWTVEWNGCAETYPGGQPAGCWAQTAGGYGDGVGTGATGGHWIIEDSAFLYNTSDGLDLLYVREEGSSIEIRRTIAQGNAGNGFKTTGPTLIENSIIVGNCGYFDGQSFTYNVDNCRYLGNALVLYLRRGDQVTVTNNTFTSEADCLVSADYDDARGNSDGSELIRLRNNIFQGHTDFGQPFENTCLAWAGGFPHDPFDIDYSVIADVKDNLCPGAHDICGVSPGLVNASIDAFDAHLLPNSPAIDAGTTVGAPAEDFDRHLRDAAPDIGAHEYAPCALAGDVNADGQVDVNDIQSVAAAWHQSPPPGYADRDGDGDVDVVDVMQVATYWGKHCPGAGNSQRDSDGHIHTNPIQHHTATVELGGGEPQWIQIYSAWIWRSPQSEFGSTSRAVLPDFVSYARLSTSTSAAGLRSRSTASLRARS